MCAMRDVIRFFEIESNRVYGAHACQFVHFVLCVKRLLFCRCALLNTFEKVRTQLRDQVRVTMRDQVRGKVRDTSA